MHLPVSSGVWLWQVWEAAGLLLSSLLTCKAHKVVVQGSLLATILLSLQHKKRILQVSALIHPGTPNCILAAKLYMNAAQEMTRSPGQKSTHAVCVHNHNAQPFLNPDMLQGI